MKTLKSDAPRATDSLRFLNVDSLALLPILKQRQFLKGIAPHRIEMLMEDWRFWARRTQLPPTGNWRTWLFLGGRGSGKTRAAAEWVLEAVETDAAKHIALIAPTIADIRDTMIEGESGIINNASKGVKPVFEPSKRRLVWPNGAKATMFSTEVPDSLRGPQFDLAWGDEFAAWKDGQCVLDTLRPALRLGKNPRLMLTTTPRPVSWLKTLLADETCAITRSSSRDNRDNLAQGFVEDLEKRYANSIYARQELEGEIIEDPEGALWTRNDIERARKFHIPLVFDRIIIAVDPPATKGQKADACGIIVAASYDNGQRAAILADLSTHGQGPNEWARAIAVAYDNFCADCIIAEANQGGEMVREIIKLAAPNAPVRLKHAVKSKRTRAEPIALLYAQGRIAHKSHFRELEDEMCSFGGKDYSKSPDRMDALVWAIAELILKNNQRPSARSL